VIGVITGFINELRAAGVPVSMVEAIDAMKAVEAIEIGERTALRETLRATLVKNLRHERAFDTAFDVYFSTLPAVETPAEGGEEAAPFQAEGPDPAGGFSREALGETLLDALGGLDGDALRRGARQAVEHLAGMEPGRPVGGTYYLYRTLRRLDMAQLEARLLADVLGDEDLTELARRLLPRTQLASLVGALKADERAMVETLLGRMHAGRRHYGPWRTGDGRDYPREALVEVLDALNYCAAELVRIGREVFAEVAALGLQGLHCGY
jgi:uncharacterized protein with von Willebrand factor type A (vWA) domain